MARKKSSTLGLDAAVPVADLLKACGRLKLVAESGGTMPALSCVLIEADQVRGRLVVSGTDLEVGLTCEMEAHAVRRPGRVCLPAKLFRQIVEAAPEELLNLEAIEGNRVRIRSGEMDAEIAGLDPDECAILPLADALDFHPADGVALLELIDAVTPAISRDESRANLNGALLVRLTEGWRMVSTDGHQLSVINRHVEEKFAHAVSAKVFLGTRFLEVLRKILADEESVAGELGFTGNQVAFRREGIELVSRLPEDAFPDYGSVTPAPQDNPHVASVARGKLARAIERLLPIANRHAHHIVLAFSYERLKLRAESADFGWITEQLEIDYSGPQIVLGLSSTYALNALGALNADFAEIALGVEHSPVVFRPKDSPLQTYLVMPQRLDQREQEAILDEELESVFEPLRETFREQNAKALAIEEARKLGRDAGKAARKEHGGPLKADALSWPPLGDWTEIEKQAGRVLPADERQAASMAYLEAATKKAKDAETA